MPNSQMVVLLTGTINPEGMSLTQLQDARVRKSQYVESIKFWNDIPDIKIVFVENTNVNLLQDVKDSININKFEFLAFNGNDYDKSLGKGYGELKCLEYAISNSKFIADSDFVFKITGRYRVLNFKKLVSGYQREPFINLLLDFKLNLTFCDSRFFGFSKEFISNYLLAYKSVVNDAKGIYFEEILTKAALKAIADGYVYRPLNTLPRIKGYSGSLGKKYNSSYLHWLRHEYKYYLKYKGIGLGHLPDL